MSGADDRTYAPPMRWRMVSAEWRDARANEELRAEVAKQDLRQARIDAALDSLGAPPLAAFKKLQSGTQKEILDYLDQYCIAVTDSFIDEAILHLDKRADTFLKNAKAINWLICVAFLLTLSISLIVFFNPPKVGEGINTLIMALFRGLALSAVVFAIIKTLIFASGAYMSEHLRLRDRRHGMRLGRLYMYLKRSEFDFQEFSDALQWNQSSTSMFGRVRPEVLTDSAINQLASALGRAASRSQEGRVSKDP